MKNYILWKIWHFKYRKDLREVKRLQKQGHTHHCACRIVWGDGECECGQTRISRKEQVKNLIKISKGEL